MKVFDNAHNSSFVPIPLHLHAQRVRAQLSGGGFVYDTEEELVRAMDRLVEDRALGERLGLRGFQAYQKSWTTEAYIGRYLALIQKIASCRHRPEGTMREERAL